jgi:hypothetical protein
LFLHHPRFLSLFASDNQFTLRPAQESIGDVYRFKGVRELSLTVA